MVDIDSMAATVAWMRSKAAIGDEVIKQLASMVEPRRFARREVLVGEGRADGRAYFVEKGMTRSYWIVDGEEITTSFTGPGAALVFSMDEMYYSIPSHEYVEAVEPLLAYAIAITDLRTLISTDLQMAIWWGRIHEDEYRRIHRSHKERLTLPAPERYAEFARQFPEVVLRARLTDIASYVGISLSTLSRIRGRRLKG